MTIQPWTSLQILNNFAIQLKQEPPLSKESIKIAQGVSKYELELRNLWEDFKLNPTEENAKKLAELMKKASSDIWLEMFLDVLGIEPDEIPKSHLDILEKELDKHHNFIENSLLPDLIKEISKGTEAFNNFDYRVIFLYVGALWSFGFLATVMFDGLSLRDLADIFIFLGPNDEDTCEGPRGCRQFVGKMFTVLEILEKQIIPGRLKCLTNCRHILLPIASPFTD